jgi:alcohol oxidase
VVGSWSQPLQPGKSPAENYLNSNQQSTRTDVKYTKKDIEHVEKWGTFHICLFVSQSLFLILFAPSVQRHVETTWHSLGTCSMGPKEGNSIVKHGVLDERLNVHGVRGLKVCDLSICPDNVGCNTFSVSFALSLSLDTAP